MSLEVFEALNEALEGSRRTCFLGEVLRTQTLLALWDGMVLDETERGLIVSPHGRAERAFTGHLAALLHVSKPRAATMLHAAITARSLPVTYGVFQTGAFAWQAMEAVVRNLGALSGDAREQYDLGAARLAAEENPQRLDPALSRLHDALDHDDATDAGAAAHRDRRVRARPGALGAATLTLTGPQTDIAAVYETAHRLAVAAHGVRGETRTMDQLRYDCTLDVILHGFASAPSEGAPDPGDDPRTPATPFERLGDPRVPHRKAIQAEILVTVPAATAVGVSDEPGRLGGWGSLPAAEMRRIVAAARYWTRVEIDPVDDAILAFDSHERAIPTALRRLISMRSDTCDEPGCPVGAHLADIDRVIRVDYRGRTVEINLSALCRSSHQDKDDGYVDVERDADGSLRWHTTRWGGHASKKPSITIRRRPRPEDIEDVPPWDVAA